MPPRAIPQFIPHGRPQPQQEVPEENLIGAAPGARPEAANGQPADRVDHAGAAVPARPGAEALLLQARAQAGAAPGPANAEAAPPPAVPPAFILWHEAVRADGFVVADIAQYAAALAAQEDDAAAGPHVVDPAPQRAPRGAAPRGQMQPLPAPADARGEPQSLGRPRLTLQRTQLPPAATQWAKDRIAHAHRTRHTWAVAGAVAALAYSAPTRALDPSLGPIEAFVASTQQQAALCDARGQPSYDAFATPADFRGLMQIKEGLGALLRQHARERAVPTGHETMLGLSRVCERDADTRRVGKKLFFPAPDLPKGMRRRLTIEESLARCLLVLGTLMQDHGPHVEPTVARSYPLANGTWAKALKNHLHVSFSKPQEVQEYLTTDPYNAIYNDLNGEDTCVAATLAAANRLNGADRADLSLRLRDRLLQIGGPDLPPLYVWPSYRMMAPIVFTPEEMSTNYICPLSLADLYDVPTDERIAQPVVIRTGANVIHVYEYEQLMTAWMTTMKNPATTLDVRPEQMFRLVEPFIY